MSYRLIITRPDGTEFDAETDGPVMSRADAGMYAGLALAGIHVPGQPPGVPIREMGAFGQRVQNATLGERVFHEASGYCFRTLEI